MTVEHPHRQAPHGPAKPSRPPKGEALKKGRRVRPGHRWTLYCSLVFTSLGTTSALAEPIFNPHLMSDVAERVTPAVVNIATQRTRTQQGAGHPMFRQFFGPDRRRFERGAGSGVIISPDGYVLTNNHVVEGADEIKVVLSDKREFNAKLIGSDKASDVALLQLKAAKNLRYLNFGDSGRLRLGEIVLAVGNPFGVGQTVTMGIVSAKGRANVGIVDYEDFIQTDAAINPGNSGGALVNLKGELVGMNTAILSRSGGAQGIGFAVPSNMLSPIRDQIVEYGRVRRGWLGVAIQDLTPEIARSMRLGVTKGVLVSDVLENGPASKAKIKAGDIIVSVNERPTQSAAQLRNKIALLKPDSRARVLLLRNGKKRNVTVTLDEKKGEQSANTAGGKGEELLSGMTIKPLNRELRAQLHAPIRVQGVVVASVVPGSAADRSGIEAGDIITAANRNKVLSFNELAKAIPKGSNEALLRIYKRGVFTFIVLRK